MDREILFRGKRLDNGKWVFGYPVCCGNIAQIGTFNVMPFGIQIGNGYAVAPSTVGQYTGLTDKKGVKIFEGDIVKTNKYGKDDGQGHNFAGPDTFEVVFEDGGYCLRNKWRRFNLRPDAGVEIIGNIHDNPELMGGEGNG